jgi:hypothetical protein
MISECTLGLCADVEEEVDKFVIIREIPYAAYGRARLSPMSSS